MSDLIPYEVIIERVKDDIDFIAEQAYERGKRDILEQSQSAQPEREKGEWIVCGDKHVCSECDEFALCDAYDVLETGEYQEKLSDFCPNCGADMR